MKKSILVLLITTLTGLPAWASISGGRQALINDDLETARAEFAQAVQQNPSSQEAKVLYAGVRLALILEDARMADFFEALGADTTDLDVDDYIVEFPETPTGDPILPNSGTSQPIEALKAWLEPELYSISELLSGVGELSSPVLLNTAEVGRDVSIDALDILTMRGFLDITICFLEMSVYYDDDVLLSTIANLEAGDGATAANVLGSFPSLFSLQSSVNAEYARFLYIEGLTQLSDAFGGMAEAAGSRSSEALFALEGSDDIEAAQDASAQLAEAVNAAGGIAVLGDEEDPVYLSLQQFFVGGVSLRSNFPLFSGGATVLFDSFPDPSFGGILPGMARDRLNYMLANLDLFNFADSIAASPFGIYQFDYYSISDFGSGEYAWDPWIYMQAIGWTYVQGGLAGPDPEEIPDDNDFFEGYSYSFPSSLYLYFNYFDSFYSREHTASMGDYWMFRSNQWLWNEYLGWIYTNYSAAPWVYRADHGIWYYYLGGGEGPGLQFWYSSFLNQVVIM